jgi:hypothetical protein
MHSTYTIDDAYLGSGQQLKAAIKKYGKINFKREILEFFPDRSSLQNRERFIINEGMLKDAMCMNIKLGGGSGPTEHSISTKMKISNRHKGKPLSESHRKNIGIASANRTPETRKKLSESRCKWKLSKLSISKTQEALNIGYRKSDKFKENTLILHQKNCKYEVPILQLNHKDEIIREWAALSEIRKFNPEWGTCSNISRIFSTNRKIAYGFKWKLK